MSRLAQLYASLEDFDDVENVEYDSQESDEELRG